MPPISPVSWLFAVLAYAALPVLAQAVTPPAIPTFTPAVAATPSNAAVTPSAPATLSYRSVFDGYQPFTDEKLIPWKDANTTVEKAGGWRAYAKEAAEPTSKAPLAEPAATASTAAPATPSAPAHADHGKH